MFRTLLVLAFLAFSCEAFMAPAAPALSRSVVSASQVQMFGGSGGAKAKKVAKKPVKKVVKKVAKKPVAKGGFTPGKQMPANQAVTELIGGFGNAFGILKNLYKD